MAEQEQVSMYALYFAGTNDPVEFRAVRGSVRVTSEGKLEHKEPSDGLGPLLVSVDPINVTAIIELGAS